MSTKSQTILHHLLLRRERSANHVAVRFKDGAQWLSYTWTEYFNLIETVGSALSSLGVDAGDRVAIASETRLEWSTSDLAIMGIGAITVPIYPNNQDDDVKFILNDSAAKILILEDKEQLEKWSRIKNDCDSVEHVVVIETDSETLADNVMYWKTLLQTGRKHLKEHAGHFIERAKETRLADDASILYTSGTTGRPKGVVLGHEQIMSELEDVFNLVAVNENDVSLSFLPYSHVLGRVEAWGNVYAGYVLAFAESVDRIKANMKEVSPTFLIAVPRIFEKIYAGILAQVENSQTKRKIFEKALHIGKQVSETVQRKKPLSPLLTLEYAIAKRLVFNNVMKAMGGRMRFAVSGGAPLAPDIARFFHGLGLLICEGYGLTETTAAISFNSPLAYKFGSVGRPLADVKVKFAPDGEILVQTKKNMKEYYKNAEATEQVFEDGYFRTGDIGHLDDEGFLHITDRKKDLIKTAGGKYVAPQKLENLLKLSPHVSNVLIHGDQKKYIVALVTVSPSLQGRINEPETNKLIQEAVAEANSSLASFESIKKFAVLPGDFTVESGELTPSLKVKRKHCDKKFEKEIAELY